MKTKTPKPKARITSISVSRLYNTGNYTNVKYDLTAEVPEGASAVEALRQMVYTLQCLKPVSKPSCLESFQAAVKKTETEQTNYEKENLPEWRERIQEYQTLKANRDAAVLALDDLGGTSIRRDAKNSWDSWDDDL